MKKTTLKITGMVLIMLMLSHCSQRGKVNVKDAVTDPSAGNDSLIQVNPMVPEAVLTLLQEAATLQANDQLGEALMTLKRALSISPASSLVQQNLAEGYLADGDYKQALYWSTLVVNQGPDQGSLCERSRRTQALAAELLGQVEVQAKALEGLAGCTRKSPARY